MPLDFRVLDAGLGAVQTQKKKVENNLDKILESEGASHLKDVVSALYGQESGSGANPATSTDGARGHMQIMPATFAQLSRPGESIDRPEDNLRVGVRLIKQLGDKFGNDPARIAVGYFSGEDNVNPRGDTPYKRNPADGNGKRVSGYVQDVLGRLVPSAQAQDGMSVARQIAGGGAATDGLALAQEIANRGMPAAEEAPAPEAEKPSRVKEIWNQLTGPGLPDPSTITRPEGMTNATFSAGIEAPEYGKRADGTAKGEGFLGALKRPDGGISTEISIGVNIDGKEVEIPALVPTLTKQEIDHLLADGKPTPAIVEKAVAHARGRIEKGLSPFAQPGEQAKAPELKGSVMKGFESDTQAPSKNVVGMTATGEAKLRGQLKGADDSRLQAYVEQGGLVGQVAGKLLEERGAYTEKLRNNTRPTTAEDLQAGVNPKGWSFTKEQAANREYLTRNKGAVMDYLLNAQRLAPEDAALEYERMLLQGVVPNQAGLENTRPEAGYGDVLSVGATRAKAGLGRGYMGLGEWLGDAFGIDAVSKFSSAAASGYEKDFKAAADDVVGRIPQKGFKALVAETAPSIISQVPGILAAGLATAISKNPAALEGILSAALLTPMGAQVFGETYRDGKDAGLSLGENTAYSAGKALAEVLPERLSLGALFKFLGGINKGSATQIATAFLGQQATEHTTEQITTVAQFLLDKAYTQPDLSLKDLEAQMVQTFKATALQAPILAAVGGGAVMAGRGGMALRDKLDPNGAALRDLNATVEGAEFVPLDSPGGQGGFVEGSRVGPDGKINWGARQQPAAVATESPLGDAPITSPITGELAGLGSEKPDVAPGQSAPQPQTEGTENGQRQKAEVLGGMEAGKHTPASLQFLMAAHPDQNVREQAAAALTRPATYGVDAGKGVQSEVSSDLRGQLDDRIVRSIQKDSGVKQPLFFGSTKALPELVVLDQSGERRVHSDSIAALLTGISGREVVLVDGLPANGVVADNKHVFLSTRQGFPGLIATAHHELRHALKDDHPDLSQFWAESVSRFADTSDSALLHFLAKTYQAKNFNWVAIKRRQEAGESDTEILDDLLAMNPNAVSYQDGGRGTLRDWAVEELESDLLGDAANRDGVIHKALDYMAKVDIGAVKQFAEFLRGVLKRLGKGFGKGHYAIDQYVHSVEALEKAASEVLGRYASRTQNQKRLKTATPAELLLIKKSHPDAVVRDMAEAELKQRETDQAYKEREQTKKAEAVDEQIAQAVAETEASGMNEKRITQLEIALATAKQDKQALRKQLAKEMKKAAAGSRAAAQTRAAQLEDNEAGRFSLQRSEDVKGRTLEEVRARIAGDAKLVIADNPLRMKNGKAFTSVDPAVLGPGYLPLATYGEKAAQVQSDKLLEEAIAEAGLPADKANLIKRPLVAKIDKAFRLMDGARYWYELSATGFVETYFALDAFQTEQLIDVVAASSGNKKPFDNVKDAISIIALDLQGRPVTVGVRDPASISAALSPEALNTHKFGNFSDTMQLVGGLRKAEPLPTIDLQMAHFYGVPQAEVAGNPVMYEALARHTIKLRDAQNAQLKKGAQPYESWQVQALNWVAQRDTTEPDDYASAMPRILEKIKEAGIPLENGKIGRATLLDPRTPGVLSPTSKTVAEASTMTFETRTLLTETGKESAAGYAAIKDVAAPWARKLRERFVAIQRNTMRLLAEKRPHPEGLKTKKPSLISTLMAVVADKSRGSHDSTQADVAGYGTFEGEVSPNLRVPMVLTQRGGTEVGGGSKRVTLDSQQRDVVLAVLGKPFVQAAMASSQFETVEEGKHDTFSVLIERYENTDIPLDQLSAFSAAIGRPINYSWVPNGWLIDINIGGFDNVSDANAVKAAVHQVFGQDVDWSAIPRKYGSNYLEAADYDKTIKEFEDGLQRNSDPGAGRSARRAADQLRDLADVRNAIRQIAEQQEREFAAWTAEARERAGKRGIRFSPSRSDAAGNERAGGRDAAAAGEPASYGRPTPGAVSAQGFHYSGAERQQLDGRYYGTGARGREADRVQAAKDKRLRERIYFYVDAGKGVTPEQGVGAHGHTVKLNNLYDVDKDSYIQLGVDPALRSDDEAWMNAFESEVIDGGFDGYLRDFGTQRAAVLLGRHSVPVTYVGIGKQTGEVNTAERPKAQRRTDLPQGKMTGAEWKKLAPEAADLEDGKEYYRSDLRFSLAREQALVDYDYKKDPADYADKPLHGWQGKQGYFWHETGVSIQKNMDDSWYKAYLPNGKSATAYRNATDAKRLAIDYAINDLEEHVRFIEKRDADDAVVKASPDRVSDTEMDRINQAQRHGVGLGVVPEDMFKRDANPGVEYSGVFQTAAEHIGDLIHRLSHTDNRGGGVGYGIEAALNKANRFLRPGALDDSLPQVKRNYGYFRDEMGYKGTAEEFEKDFLTAANRYKEAYQAMPYATLPQYLGRRAAINLGALDFAAVRRDLKELVGVLEAEDAEAAYWRPFQAGARLSPARGVESNNDLPNQQPGNRTLDGAELRALRRAAARLEDPERGVTFRVTEDGQAIVTGPARFNIPTRFRRFAEDNGLTFKAERGSARLRPNGTPERTRIGAMPEEYRASGAKYAQEMGDNYDRTGVSRFSPQRITVDGVERPTTNSNGKPIAQTEEGLRNFWRWFAGSVVVDAEGRPLVVYHGTNKDFTEFNVSRTSELDLGSGIYLTRAPYRASLFGNVVMPVYVSMKNPFVISEDAPAGRDGFGDYSAFKYGENDELQKALIDAGYDGVIDNRTGNIAVFRPTQIKSAIGNNGQFSPTNPDIRYSPRRQTDTPAFLKWFGDSKVVDAEGRPLVVYHGTYNDVSAFRPNDIGLIFAAPDRSFAEQYAMRGAGTDPAKFFDTIEEDGLAPNVMPIYLSLQNPWNYHNDDHVVALLKLLRKKGLSDGTYIKLENWSGDFDRIRASEIRNGDWAAIEYQQVVDAIKELGHDGIVLNELGFDNYAAFEPTQIKSAIGNNGQFSPTNPDIRYSPPRWYFSPLEKAIESAPDRVFTTAPQVKLWLAGNKAKLGLKDDEIFWTGINDWLDLQGKAKVSKADVMAYLAGNGVQVEEVQKGVAGYNEDDPQLPKDGPLEIDEANERDHGALARRYEYVVVDRRSDNPVGFGHNEEEAIADAYSGHPSYWEVPNATKYGQWQLPGGENYRELLLTLPVRSDKMSYSELIARKKSLEDAMEYAEGVAWDEMQEEWMSIKAQLRETKQYEYRSSHWDEPNILAHIRMNDRTDAEGNKVLFVEELQSDWGQAGKKYGFANDLKLKDGVTIEKQANGKWWLIERDADGEIAQIIENDTREQVIDSARDLSFFKDSVTGGIPAAPFVTDTKAWVALAVKRIMAYAAANGYDKVAFINGEQSADRYDLSKQVDRIAIGKYGDSGYQVVARRNGEVVLDRVAEDAKALENLVGKEIAQKHVETGQRVFEGLDLKIGGSGMVEFYDRIVPSVTSKLVEKMGGKMEAVSIHGLRESGWQDRFDRAMEAGDYRAADALDKQTSTLQQLGFPVTPAMGKPLPLFSPARAQTETPEFKRWFGDWDHPKAFTSKFPADKTPPSMAMDWENNRPLVLFHATNGDFNTFETGRESVTSTTFGPVDARRHAIFTTPDSKFAESYLKKGGGENVMPVYMDIKAPMDLRNNGAWNYADELVKNGFDNYRWPNRSDTEMWEMFDDEMGEAFVAAAKKAGYDGAIMFEVDDNDKMVEVYVAFDPAQIKSAIGNNGQFDPTNPDIRYSPNRLIQRIDAATDGLSNLPDQFDYLRDRYLALGKVARVDEIIREIRKGFDGLPQADKAAVYAYLTTRGAPLSMIGNPEGRAMAKRVKDVINYVGDALVARGLLDPAARAHYRDQYLPRLYLKHLMSEADWKMLGAGKKPTDMGYIKHRKDIAAEIRELVLGEIKDPSFLAANAIGRAMRDVALLDWMGKISQHNDWVYPGVFVNYRGQRVTSFWLKAEADRIEKQIPHYPPANQARAGALVANMRQVASTANLDYLDHKAFKQIPDTIRYGMLRGMWVRKEIFNDIMGASQIVNADPTWFEDWFGFGGKGTRLTQWWKFSKVALNPPGQVRNFISNMVMLQLSGVGLHKLPFRLIQAAREITSDGPHWKVAKKYGVTESTFTAQELFRVKRDLLALENGIGRQNPLTWLSNAGAHFFEKVSDLYQFSEALGKTIKIIDEMEKGKSEAEAAIEAQKWLFDYSLVPQSVRIARNSPIGMPFLTYQVKVLPRLLEVAMTAPWRFLPWAGLIYGMQAYVASLFGVDDDDLKKLKKSLPQWLQDRGHTVFLPGRDADGRLQVADIGYFFPWTFYTQLAKHLAEGNMKKVLADDIGGMFSAPFIGGAAALISNYNNFTKKPIYNEADPTSYQAAAIANYTYDLMAPPFISSHGFVSPMGLVDKQYGGKMVQALAGTTNKFGDPKATTGQAIAGLLGFNFYGMDPEHTRATNLQLMAGKVKDAETSLRQKLMNRGLSDEERRKVMADYRTKMLELGEEAKKYAEESEVPEQLRVRK